MSDPQKNSDDEEATLPSIGPPRNPGADPSKAEPTKVEPTSPFPEFLGRYRVEKLLAVGGFGAVFRAWDEELKRTVAIKLVRSELITPESQKSFLDEARIVAGLNHPNIVPAFDLGRTEQGDYFIVSRLVDGADLNKRMQQYPISQRHAVQIASEIADALSHAHSQGLVHRDVKPANILIDSKGRAFLTDFGIALQEHSDIGGQKFAGTPEYMSPEQLRGESHRVDHRSDIYSLGLVLYRLLTGRGPFRYQNVDELIEKVCSGEIRTPRLFNEEISEELERVCLRALAKKPNDRYPIAADFADDLRWLLNSSKADALGEKPSRTPTNPSGVAKNSSAEHTVVEPEIKESSLSDKITPDPNARVTPKGLRAFDESDADFFLRLLPGPYDRRGISDGLRTWISRLVSRHDQTPMAIAIYGPSGCGKSSLIRAGVITRLEKDIQCIAIDATALGTEAALAKKIHSQFPNLPDSSLGDALRTLRKDKELLHGNKLLLIIDQFEQWLDNCDDYETSEFTEAIRQCDGKNIQAVFLVRDDFWVPLNRFFRELEIHLVDGSNCDLVDLFSKNHAYKVLGLFGTAFGKLDPNEANWSPENIAFLKQSVDALCEDGKVVPVKLSLFADTMKGRDWTPNSLKDIGGIEGVGLVFLNEAFSSKYSKPEFRQHEEAAQRILTQLLPPKGSDIKGVFKSEHDLRAASGYADKPQEFESLLNILDRRLRLITPSNVNNQPEYSRSGTYYQLTHDYLVPSIREWLTRYKRTTSRGRAELALDECARFWSEKRDDKQLPTFWESVAIYASVPSKTWTPLQSDMMRSSVWHHGARVLFLLVYLSGLAVFGLILRQNWIRQDTDKLARERVRQVQTVAPENLNELINDPIWTEPIVERYLKPIYHSTHSNIPNTPQFHAEIIAVKHDKSLVYPLRDEYLNTQEIAYLKPLIRVLSPHANRLRPDMRSLFKDSTADPRRRLYAAIFLVQQPSSDGLQEWSKPEMAFLANQLVRLNAEDQPTVRRLLLPIANQLLPPIEALFADPNQSPNVQVSAANAIKDFAKEDRGRLADLIATANPSQFTILFPLLANNPDQTVINQLTAIAADTSETSNETLADVIRKGQRRATAAIALMKLGHHSRITPIFFNTSQPEPLSQFIHLAKAEGITAIDLLHCLEANHFFTDNTNALYAFISLLGDFSPDELTKSSAEEILSTITDLFHSHPESKIHAIARWLLVRWGKQDTVREFESTTIPYALDRQWFQLAIDLPINPQSPAIKKRFTYSFIVFQPGNYQLGSTEQLDPDRQQDETPYVTEIKYPFAVLDREITFEEILCFANSPFADEMKKFQATPDQAAFFTTWFDSVAFCRWLSQQIHLQDNEQAYADPNTLPSDTFARDPNTTWAPLQWPIELDKPGFRLPMESEWEIAARGTSKARFSFGGDTALLQHYGWFDQNSNRRAHAPKELRPNLRGLFDTQGNVFEWCHGWTRNDRPTVETNPVGPETGASRVDRGGGWYYGANQCRVSFQYGDDPSLRGHNLGFRIAITLDPHWIERSENLTTTTPLPPSTK
jgi:serine/threonine protein kinase/formylglycine-generating enzyme required for sulfatase activity